MKSLKSIFSFILVVTIVLTGTSLTAFAGSRSPYCHLYSDNNSGNDILQYWSYKSGESFASERTSRRITIKPNGKMLLGASTDDKETIGSNAANLTQPVCWNKSGTKIIWITRDCAVHYRNYEDGYLGEAHELCQNAEKFVFNSELFLKKVMFKTGVTKTLQQLLDGDTEGTVGNKPSEDADYRSSTSSEVDEYQNTNGTQFYEFDGNVVKIRKNGEVFINDCLVTQYLTCGVKFAFIDYKKRVYLQEKKHKTKFFRYSIYNKEHGIFMPASCILPGFIRANKEDTGYVKTVDIKSGTYPVERIAIMKPFYAPYNYAINKFDDNYAQFFIEGTSKIYTAIRKGKKLTVNGKKIATGIKKWHSYGFSKGYVHYIKGGWHYKKALSGSRTVKVKRANRLTYDSEGLVRG